MGSRWILLVAMYCGLAATAFANPQNLTVVAGQAEQVAVGPSLQVTVSDRAILDWGSFSIGQGETTQFIQPSANSAVLNRVLGGNMSEIYGTLQANGKVFLVNPQGIIVGSEGVINTAAFLATTLQVDDKEFLADEGMRFWGESDALLQNWGKITTPTGSTILLACKVQNTGSVQAEYSYLGAGQEFYLQKEGIVDLLIHVDRGGATLSQEGTIEALLIQLETEGTSSFAIQHKGLSQVTCVEEREGKIYLKSVGGIHIEKGGELLSPGAEIILEAREILFSGEARGSTIDLITEKGCVAPRGSFLQAKEISFVGQHFFSSGSCDCGEGQISLFGEEMIFCAADLHAKGGKIYVGGLREGAENPQGNAKNVFINPATHFSAEGGEIILWADEKMEFRGSATADFVEISGGEVIQRGPVQAKHFLLDPENVTIASNVATGSPAFAFIEPSMTQASSGFGDSIGVLANGNVAISSPNASGGAGAVYLYSISTGALINYVTGSVSTDNVGSGGITVLQSSNDSNYVIASPNWNSQAGAATWVSGSSGLSGAVSIGNSLYGTISGAEVSSGGIIALTNGNYVVSSPLWGTSATGLGAATWGSGSTGVTGAVAFGGIGANSIAGANSGGSGDRVSSGGITALTNGNYVIASPFWSPLTTSSHIGAATFASGTAATTGTVTSSNSMVGASSNDNVSSGGIEAVINGGYVISSPSWTSTLPPFEGASIGAVTYISSLGPMTGTVSGSNSITGESANDRVGYGGCFALLEAQSGNFVISSPYWQHSGVAVGAATYVNVSSPPTSVSNSNSMIGSASGDNVSATTVGASLKGSIYPLNDGNYVICSGNWSSGVGAATYIKISSGTTGTVSSANSLVGATPGDHVSSGGVYSLNGSNISNFVIASPKFGNQKGAATWSSSSSVATGALLPTNSFVGLTNGDSVGEALIALADGNYVVGSPGWTNTSLSQASAGAATWFNGSSGESADGFISPAISSSNSLYGPSANAETGTYLTACASTAYVVASPGISCATYLPTHTSYVGPVMTNLSINSNPAISGTMTAPLDNETGDIVIIPFPGAGVNQVYAGIKNYTDLATSSNFADASVTLSPAYIQNIVNTGTSFTIATTENITLSNNLTFSEVIGATFTLTAGGAINLNAGIMAESTNLSLTATGAITASSSTFSTVRGYITFDAGSTLGITSCEITAGTGNISLTGTSITTTGGNIDTGSGIILLEATSSNLTNGADIQSTSGDISLTATTGAISNTGELSAGSSGTLSLTAETNITDSSGSYTTDTGELSFTAGSALSFTGSSLETTAAEIVGSSATLSINDNLTLNSGSSTSSFTTTGNTSFSGTTGSTITLGGTSATFSAGGSLTSTSETFSATSTNINLSGTTGVTLSSNSAINTTGGNILLSSSMGSISNSAPLETGSAGTITFTADTGITNAAELVSDTGAISLTTSADTLANTAEITSTSGAISLTATAGSITNSSTLSTGSSATLALTAGTNITDSAGSYTTDTGELSFDATSALSFTGSSLETTAAEIVGISGTLSVNDNLTLNSGSSTSSFTTTGNTSFSGTTGSTITLGGTSATFSAGGTLTSTSETFSATSTNINLSGTTGVTLSSNSAINTTGGNILLSSSMGSISNSAPLETGSAGTITFTADTGITNAAELVSDTGAISLTTSADTLANTAEITSTSGAISLTATAGSITNSSTLSTGSSATLALTAGTNITDSAGSYTTDTGELSFDATSTLSFTGSSLHTTAAEIVGTSGTLSVNDNLTLNSGSSTSSFTTTGNMSFSGTSSTITLGGTSATFSATGSLSSTSETFSATTTNINLAGEAGVTLSSNSAINTTSGHIALSSSGGNIANSAPCTTSGGNLSLTANTGLTNSANLVSGAGNILLSVSNGPLTNNYVTLPKSITSTSGNITLTSSAGTLTNTQTLTTGSTGIISLSSSGDLTNSGGATTVSGNITLTSSSGNLTNNDPSMMSDSGNILLQCLQGTLTNSQNLTTGSSGDIELLAYSGISNSGALQTDTGSITLSTTQGNITETADVTGVGGNITIVAANDLTTNGASPTISTTSGNIYLVAADSAVSPNVGTGVILLSSTTEISTNGGIGGGGTLVQLYTSTPVSGNTFPTAINGVAVPGIYEYFFIYYPDGTEGDPFAIFYQAMEPPPPPPPPSPTNPALAKEELGAAINEEYVHKLSLWDFENQRSNEVLMTFINGEAPLSLWGVYEGERPQEMEIENSQLPSPFVQRAREEQNRADFYHLISEKRPTEAIVTKIQEELGSLVQDASTPYFQQRERESQMQRALFYSKSFPIFYQAIGQGKPKQEIKKQVLSYEGRITRDLMQEERRE